MVLLETLVSSHASLCRDFDFMDLTEAQDK